MKFNWAKEHIESTKFLQMRRATRMQKRFEDASDVCSIYERSVATPAGGVITLEIVDWVQVANSKLTEQKIFYDPR